MNCQLRIPNQSHLFGQIEQNAAHATRMAVYQTAITSRTLAICGAGPSLAHQPVAPHTHVWACNSALPYLMDRGVRVTHGFGIDQGTEMLAPKEWERTFPVRYLVASSVHPSLVTHLLASGRKVTFFHSFLGIPDPEGWTPPAEHATPGLTYEMWLYRHKYKDSVQVGYGLNSVPRAICLALAMGYRTITVYGADCAARTDSPPMPALNTAQYADWMRDLVMYADGRCAGVFGTDATMAEAVIDGVRWHTRPDMVISAMHMLHLIRDYPGRIRLEGETLPVALSRQTPEFLGRMPALTGMGLVSGFGNAALVAQEA